jgi:predicted lipoprotein with Yx(FWY)xxD motif
MVALCISISGGFRMRTITTLGMAVVLILAVSVSGYAKEKKAKLPKGVKVQNMVLTDSKGMTLYTFDKDATPGKSVCNGPCAQTWPPLAAPADAKAMGDWTVVTRDDGSKQWAYRGKPLYRFAKDAKPGDMTGDGFLNGAWHTAKL